MNTFIHIIWKENTKYRAFSDLISEHFDGDWTRGGAIF